MNNKVSLIVRQAILAATYAVLTIINPFSYENIQFRISEILLFLVFYKKENAIGLILGCFFANLFSPMLIWDITLGVSATILTVIAMMYSKNIFVSGIYPIVFNAFIVGFELYIALGLPFWLSTFQVAIGEAVVIILGIIIFKVLEKNKAVMDILVPDSKKIKDNEKMAS